MEQLIEFYAKKNMKQNEGYRFIKVESVYLPILQVYLTVTKRDYYSLPLLDEIVLRLIEENVHEITELVGILGIERNLLEVTLADLCVKDLIYCTADRCSLMAKGRTALKELSVIQRSKECLKNIYLDPISESILLEHERLNFLERVYDDDRKLDADFERNDINVFKKNIESIQKIFDEEMNIYADRTKAKPSELLSIEEIEKVYSKFVKLSFAIFVSDSGYDIDIVAMDRNMEGLLAQYKEEIITQIRTHKILKSVFTKFALKKQYVSTSYDENAQLVELAKKYYKTQKNSDEREEIKQEIERQIYTERKLKETEFFYLLSYFCKNEEHFEIQVDCLDDWCYGNDFFTSVLSRIGAKKIESICFSTIRNLAVCQRNVNRTVEVDKKHYKQISDLPYFAVVMSNGWKIRIIPEDIPVLDSNTHIYRYEYILEHIEI
ncbi:MAG: hypothetical protein ACI4E2_00520 [Acetatifactor sp.]